MVIADKYTEAVSGKDYMLDVVLSIVLVNVSPGAQVPEYTISYQKQGSWEESLTCGLRERSLRNFVVSHCIGNLGLEFRQTVKAGVLTPFSQKGENYRNKWELQEGYSKREKRRIKFY